jgi:branched-subunit amino acid transport protein
MAQAVRRRPLTVEAGFVPGSIHVEFLVDKVALGQVFLRVLRFSPVNIIHSTIALQLVSSGG